MALNVPDTRQRALAQRLLSGTDLTLTDIADEYGVSIDTARRDLIALEAAGMAQRVRGGAVPRSALAAPMQAKLRAGTESLHSLALAATRHLADADTILIDGGLTALTVARALRPRAGLLVATPSPWVAIACHENGIETVLLGGQLSASGGIAVGGDCVAQLETLAADIAVLGACGFDAGFGLSSDILAEVAVKRQMAASAATTMVVTGGDKIGTRARYRTLPPDRIDLLVTDASPAATAQLERDGLAVVHA